jgi:hypothetical protein
VTLSAELSDLRSLLERRRSDCCGRSRPGSSAVVKSTRFSTISRAKSNTRHADDQHTESNLIAHTTQCQNTLGVAKLLGQPPRLPPHVAPCVIYQDHPSGLPPQHTTARSRVVASQDLVICSPRCTEQLPADHTYHTTFEAVASTYCHIAPSRMRRLSH